MVFLATLWYRQGVDSEQNEHTIFLQVSDWSAVDLMNVEVKNDGSVY